METFEEYLQSLENQENRQRFSQVLKWVEEKYPELEKRIAWKQPMFTHQGTYIIGFSYAKKHMSISPEGKGIREFAEELDKRGFKYGKMTIQFPWDKEFDYELLAMMIEYNIEDKKDWKKFWR